MADIKQRDWVALIWIPLVLLGLNWINTSRSEAASAERELNKERVELINQVIEDEWADGVATETIGRLRGDPAGPEPNTVEYANAKKDFNEVKSHLYVDTVNVNVLIVGSAGSELAKALDGLIRTGADDSIPYEYAQKGKGRYRDAADKVRPAAIRCLEQTMPYAPTTGL